MFKCYDQFVVGLDYNLNARTLSENLTNVHRRQRKETPYYDYPLTRGELKKKPVLKTERFLPSHQNGLAFLGRIGKASLSELWTI